MENESSQAQTILIFSASYGAGHTRAAQALVEHLEQDGRKAVHKDILSFFSSWQKHVLQFPYLWIVRNIPTLYGIFFKITQREPFTSLFRASYIPFWWIHKKRILNYIASQHPDVIICTHFLASDILSYFVKKGISISPYYVCITDYGYHPIWKSKHAVGYFVGASEVASELERDNIPSQSIYLTGIPVSPIFSIDKKKKVTNTITVILGGYGLIAPLKKISTIAQENPSSEIIVICGKNKKLTNTLQRKLSSFSNVTVTGWVDNIASYITKSSRVVTKTGGITVTECLVANVPIDPTDPIPGQETQNFRFLQKRHLLFPHTEQKNTDGIPVFSVDTLPF